MVRPSPARRFIDFVQGRMQSFVHVLKRHPRAASTFIDFIQCRMQSFVLKSLRSKTTATACSNLAHLCNISLVVSRLRIKDQGLACREIRIRPERQRQHRTVPVEASGKLVTLYSLGLFPPLGPKSLDMRLRLSAAMMAVSSQATVSAAAQGRLDRSVWYFSSAAHSSLELRLAPLHALHDTS